MYKINLSVLIIFVIAACTSNAGKEIPEEVAVLENLSIIAPDAEPRNSFNFEPVAFYGESETIIFGRINGTVVGPDGRVYLTDFNQKTIHVFDADGTYLTNLGSEGGGPGEFDNISNPNVDESYIYAYDWSKRAVNAFDRETMQFSHSVRLMREDWNNDEISGMFPGQYFPLSDGSFLVQFSSPFRQGESGDEERFVHFYRIGPDGDLHPGEVFQQPAPGYLMDQSGDGFMVMGSPFGDRPLLEIGADDRLYSAWSEDYLIRIYSSDGEYERAVYHPYKRSRLDRNEIIDRYDNENLRRMVRNADAPDYWPALHQIKVDDENRLWVATIIDDRELYQWWVIDSEGELVSRFEWPRNRNIQQIQGGYVYTRETDEETGLLEVVRYRIGVEG